MAGITNTELLRVMATDIAIIKKAIEPLPDMFKDIYIGNGEPPLRDTCREYLEEKRCRELAKTEEVKDKKDDNKWLKRTAWGALITGIIGGLIGIAFLYIKLAPILAAIK